ncbi:Squalene synthase [hydrothermal vent metagenome]|uniref:Squalene synthase n=1 Tax=hydrothermal vent metagenome TaxID=652676 RepID=A0A3B0YK32_9ZZZZ
MSIDQNPAISEGYRWCRQLAHSHYENFPVASLLLPCHLRGPIAAVYAFARTADDVADEGNATAAERLKILDNMSTALRHIEAGQPPNEPLYQALADTVRRYQLPIDLFEKLLSAFRQDVTQHRYENFGQLMGYCQYSANPVGRLLLHLEGQASERHLALSDAVCSALQLINFLQDIGQDCDENNRIYLPQDEMLRFGVNARTLSERRNNPAVRALIQFQIQRAAKLLRSGSPLGTSLSGRFGLEIRAIILGGSRILEKLACQEDLFSRPRLNRTDRMKIAWGALSKSFH